MGELKVLNETVCESKMKITENNSNKKGVLASLEGPFAEIETKNRNGRIYSKSLWENVINSDYVQEMLENKTLFGEADHPEDRFEISLPKISHVVTDLWIDESKNKVMGSMDILDTPAGEILYTVVEYGSKIGISARAAGSLKEENGVKRVVEDDYTFFTFDSVPNPGFETTRLNKKGNKIAASNNRLEDEEDVDIEEMKENIEKKIENAKKENLDIVKSLIESIGFDKKNYKEIIDIIEDRKDGKSDLNKVNNSSQENTLSLLEKSQRKAYKLEKKNEDLKEQVDNLKDEVNRLSEGQKKSSLLDEEVYKEELAESRERINKLEGLVKDLKVKAESAENKVKDNEEIDELEEKILKLKREKKSKEIYADLLEDRIENISEDKVDKEKMVQDLNKDKNEVIDERDKLVGYIEELEERNEELEKLEDKYDVLEKYVIAQIAGKTGAEEELVRKYIPENFDIKDISVIENKVKKDLRKGNKYRISEKVDIGSGKVDLEEDKNKGKNKEKKRLTSLVGKLSNK